MAARFRVVENGKFNLWVLKGAFIGFRLFYLGLGIFGVDVGAVFLSFVVCFFFRFVWYVYLI